MGNHRYRPRFYGLIANMKAVCHRYRRRRPRFVGFLALCLVLMAAGSPFPLTARSAVTLEGDDGIVSSPSMRSVAEARAGQVYVVEQENVPFATVQTIDPTLGEGEQVVLQAGEEGLIEQKYLVVYENGELIYKKLVDTVVLKMPVNEWIALGSGEPWQVLATVEEGDLLYTQVMDMVATGYTAGPESTGEWSDGYTFAGLRAGHGVVAVDPEVIPLGTMLYIPGYGQAIAGDIGGAIKGYRIDLGFETVEEAMRFGRQKVKVYVLYP